MEAGKKVLLFRVISALLTASVLFLIALTVFKVLNSPYSVIIEDKDMNFYRAGNLFICGNTVICRMDPEPVKERVKLPEENRARFIFKTLSMQDIISIETVQAQQVETKGTLQVNREHLGRFKIHLQGYQGILVLGVSNERVYGTVRFPQWGKGAVETLKGVRISGGEVNFIRSASTEEEMKRLGANYLFKQKFSGSYSPSGKVIKGFMVNDRGERHEWDAARR